MRVSPLRRAGTLAAIAAVLVTLAACSDEGAGADPTSTSATTAATSEPTDSESTATQSPTETSGSGTSDATRTDVPVTGGGPEELRAFLPEGFPIPEELTITGDPTATARNVNVTFTVPDAVEAFDFFETQLPEAGYEILPGSSESYSTDVSSGAILAQNDERQVNLLIVDDEVEITITARE